MARGRPRKQHSIADLQKLLGEQRQRRNKLTAERKKLQAKMEQLDREISTLDGAGANGAAASEGTRPRNAKPLPDVIADVLKKASKPMKVGAIADAVKGTGYQSNSANFRGIVNQTLIKDDRFASASRGMYHSK